MADLLGGGGPAVSNGAGASSSRPTAPPAQIGSPSRGIRGPRMIMQERQEREARQRAEREAMERARAEEEALLIEQENRRLMEQERERRAAAGAAAERRAHAPTQQQEIDPAIQRREERARASGRAPQTPIQQQQAQQRPQRTVLTAQAAPPPQPQFSSNPIPSGIPAAAAGPSQQPGTGEASGAGANRPRNSFPHAFERWEALSAHWEGLTSFWMRQLQQRSEEIDRDPLSQQLARQVTDLSAAGANLFHAVVELQRLRASSERKFQRWFFETRAEQERNSEVNAMLENALNEERRGRADAVRDAVKHDRANSKTQKQFAEMRKELSISKEEARRAWEELGRREQEERDRTISLQQGLPTIVGGVQVVPMMAQGGPNRQASTRSQAAPPQQPQQPEYTRASAPSTSAPTTSAAQPAGGFYNQPAATVHEQQAASYAPTTSEGGYSEVEYMIDQHGNYVRDAAGQPVPFRGDAASPGDDESEDNPEDFETPASQPHVGSSHYPPSSSHTQADYSGQGYGAPGWETMPRHHHPTRLSDVIEEDDERSRTSASQISRGH